MFFRRLENGQSLQSLEGTSQVAQRIEVYWFDSVIQQYTPSLKIQMIYELNYYFNFITLSIFKIQQQH